MINTKTTKRGRSGQMRQMGRRVLPYLLTCLPAYLPSLCLGVLVVILLGLAGAARAQTPRCDRLA